MKILLVHNYYGSRGGEDVSFDSLENLLINKNIDVVRFTKNLRDLDTSGKKIKNMLSFFYSRDTLSELEALLKKEKPDIANVHNIYPLITPSVYRILHRYNIPVVQTVHNYRLFCSNGLCLKNGSTCTRCISNSFRNIFNICREDKKFYDFLLGASIYLLRKKTLNLIRHFIALSNFQKDLLIKSGIDGNKITVIRNIRYTEDSKVKPSGKREYFLYVGRLSQEKGIVQLAGMFENMPGMRLKILGEGPLFDLITERIKIKQIENIEMAGFVSGFKKAEIVSKAHAVIIPSLCFEVAPLVICESFQAGIPVIVKNSGSLSENIEEGENGYKYNDFAELKNILDKLSGMNQGQALEISGRCIQSYNNLFDPDKNTGQLVNLFKKFL